LGGAGLLGRKQRHAWAYCHVPRFISDKAAWAGVPVYLVDLSNTSWTCPRCGHCAEENRTTQTVCAGTYPTQPCGFTGHAAHGGEINVAARAEEQHRGRPSTGLWRRPRTTAPKG
jgi:transposase